MWKIRQPEGSSATRSGRSSEAECPQDFSRSNATDRAGCVDRCPDVAVGREHEAGCLHEGAFTGFDERSGRPGNCDGINLGEQWKLEAQPTLEVIGVVDRIDRRSDDVQTFVLQQASVYGKVNQLLTAIRSPMATEQLDEGKAAS